jgi:hypothetical protein
MHRTWEEGKGYEILAGKTEGKKEAGSPNIH